MDAWRGQISRHRLLKFEYSNILSFEFYLHFYWVPIAVTRPTFCPRYMNRFAITLESGTTTLFFHLRNMWYFVHRLIFFYASSK